MHLPMLVSACCETEPLQRCGRSDSVKQRFNLYMQSQHCLGALRSWGRALTPNAECESQVSKSG